MFFYQQWIPDFSFFEHKIKSLFNIDEAFEFIKLKIDDVDLIHSNEDLFWTLLLLYQTDKLNIVNKKLIKKKILELKDYNGGFKYLDTSECADIWNTFYCISSLILLGFDDIIEKNDVEFIIKSQNLGLDGNGGFFHCFSKNCPANCDRQVSVKSSFFALSTLALLGKLHKIDNILLKNYLNQKTSNNIDLIYQTLSLIVLNEDHGDIDMKAQTILSWQKLQSGFGIDSQYSSIQDIYWAGILLLTLEKIDLIDFGGVFDFIKNMQEKSGGISDQYTSINQKGASLGSTAQGLLNIFFIWKSFIDSVEEEILIQFKDSSDVDLIPISKKFSVNLKLINLVVDWLISNNWFKAKKLDRIDRLQDYIFQQNETTKKIIKDLMVIYEANPDLKRLNLNDFCKDYEFSNPLERVKLVFNDFIINKFITGDIKTQKKTVLLENSYFLREYILLTEPFNPSEILKEKEIKKLAKSILITIYPILNNLLKTNSRKIHSLIEQEKISEAKESLNEVDITFKNKIQNFEELMNKINSNNRVVSIDLLITQFEKNWPDIKSSLLESFSRFNTKYQKKIKEKDDFTTERFEKAGDRTTVNSIEDTIDNKELDFIQNEIKLKTFFNNNYTNHDEVNSFIQKIIDSSENFNSTLNSKITTILSTIKFDEFKKEIEILKINWSRRFKQSKKLIKSYQNRIDKRIELNNYIAEKTSELHNFSEMKKKQTISLIKQNKIPESSNLFLKSVEEFNNLSSEYSEVFYVKVDKINQEIPDFRNFSADIKLNWNKKFENEQNIWNNITVELKEKLHLGKEFDKKKELQDLIQDRIKDIKTLIESMREITFELIKSKNLTDATNKTNDFYMKASERIKECNQIPKDFIKSSLTQFKTFKETVSDIVKYWETEKVNLISYLNEIRDELHDNIEKTGSKEKKIELYYLIKNNKSTLENKITKIKSEFNQIIESKKRLSEFEPELLSKKVKIESSLKSFDNQIISFVKTTSRIHDNFEELIKEELELWNKSNTSIQKTLNSVLNKINDDIFIEKVQFIVKAFKDNKGDISYLSKVLKIKTEPLTIKLITLISNQKLKAKIDSSASVFILEEEQNPEKFLIDDIECKEKQNVDDPIIQDILKLRYLIVIHTEMGASIYNRKLGDWHMDSDIIGGFLTAIQDFSSEIKKKRIPIKRMEYYDFEIILEQGKRSVVALFIDGKETEWIRRKINLYVEEFEKIHEEILKHWNGEIRSFKNSNYLIDKVFELYRVQSF